MKHLVTVREYARLTTTTMEPTLDQATVSPSAFDWLCQQSARLKTGGATLVHVEDRQWLRLDNYVGVVETPCGTCIEILPKHVDDGDDPGHARQLLIQMLSGTLDLPAREMGPAWLQSFRGPLPEWLIGQFLSALDYLIKRGLRFDYRRIEEEERFLRGCLSLTRQIRQSPGRQHLFHIQHDLFGPNRPENRLLRSALDRVIRATKDSTHWRLARELEDYLSVVPPSEDIDRDFRQWRHDRLMAHYQPIKPWCELILNRQMPLTVTGHWHGISFLFPMERLFERYVAGYLRQNLANGARLITQAAGQYLCHHLGSLWFQLRPDLVIELDQQRWILDTKWKRLDAAANNSRGKYGLSQSDFYQMFAYGQRYLDGKGDMVLIFPGTKDFNEALQPFYFSEKLKLWVAPFDLKMGILMLSELIELPVRWPSIRGDALVKNGIDAPSSSSALIPNMPIIPESSDA